jgi:hypothetical protein
MNNWREENITEKQEATIIKMQRILAWTCDIPTKRGEACDRIKELIKETGKRIGVTGTMGYNPDYELQYDELEGNFFDADEIDNNVIDFFDDDF